MCLSMILELHKLVIPTGINYCKYENIPVSVTGDNVVQAVNAFENANLRPMLMENITKSGYKVPTPIQKHSIPIIMAGRDLMACAQTGSGKTAAFLIPVIHRLISSDADPGVGASSASPQALVMSSPPQGSLPYKSTMRLESSHRGRISRLLWRMVAQVLASRQGSYSKGATF